MCLKKYTLIKICLPLSLCLFIQLCVMQIQTYAQELPPIQLDRPDQTECPFITPKNYIQIEHGITMENIRNNQSIFSHPTSLSKFGINEKLEFRLITEFITQQINDSQTSGLAPVTFGFKTALLEENGIIPKTSFIGHLTTSNLGSKAFHTPYVAPSFRFTMQHTLTNRIALAYNLGAEWNGITAAHTYIYTLTNGFSLTKRLSAYAELYGFLTHGQVPDHRMDGGFTYLINRDLIIDLSGGLGMSKQSPENYIAFGISHRFRAIPDRVPLNK